jgi:hypothetical protein
VGEYLIKLKKILSAVEKGKTIDKLTECLEMNRSTLLAIIEFMIGEGYLEKINAQCSACPFSSNCSVKDEGVKMYALTRRGKEFLNE